MAPQGAEFRPVLGLDLAGGRESKLGRSEVNLLRCSAALAAEKEAGQFMTAREAEQRMNCPSGKGSELGYPSPSSLHVPKLGKMGSSYDRKGFRFRAAVKTFRSAHITQTEPVKPERRLAALAPGNVHVICGLRKDHAV